MHLYVQLLTPALDAFGEGEPLDLNDRSAHVLRMRSGMWDGDEHTFKEMTDLSLL
jgi:DNA-directed RNA polymerase sigma subunit (sigma70/sigma32)